MTNKKFFSGNSVKQAVLQAARHFQLAPEEVAYKEVERRHGFLKVRRRAVIAVDLDQPRRPLDEAPPPEPASAEGPAVVDLDGVASEAETEALPVQREPLAEGFATEAAAEDVAEPEAPASFSGDRTEAAEEAIRRLLALGGLDLGCEVKEGDEGLEVELRGDDEDLLLDDRGRILMSIQHLLPRLMRGLTGESVPCAVDSDNFHEIRAEQLRHLAQRVAGEVRDSERSQILEPMAPDERRIVHLTLADDPAVETVSQGNGLFKRVQVRPNRS